MGYTAADGTQKKIEGVPNKELTFKPSRANALRSCAVEPKSPGLKPHRARSPTRAEERAPPFPFHPTFEAAIESCARPYRAPRLPHDARRMPEPPREPEFPFEPDFAGVRAALARPPAARHEPVVPRKPKSQGQARPLPFTFSPDRQAAVREYERKPSPLRPLTEPRRVPVELPPVPFSFKPDRAAAIAGVRRPRTVPPQPVVPRRPAALARSLPAIPTAPSGAPDGEIGAIPE